MKKFLLRLSLFFFLAVIFVVVGIICWGAFAPYLLKKNLVYAPATHAHMYTRIKDVRSTKNVDILFLGSSVCYRGFDTRIFKQYGYHSFNLGSSNQTHIQTEVLLSHYLASLHPKLVIYEVSPIVFTVDGVESGLDLISNDFIDFATLRMALYLNNIKVYNSALFAFYKQLTTGYQDLEEPVTREILTYIKGGFEESVMSYYKSDSVFTSRDYVFKHSQLNAFKRNISLLKKNKIPYLLIQAPNTKSVYRSITNTHQIDSIFNASGTYINFNNQTNFSDSIHFCDHNHLNRIGVKLFNEKLIPVIDNYLKKPNN